MDKAKLDYEMQYTLIELTNSCNLKCPMCPQSFDGGMGEKGFMDYETFKKVVDGLPVRKKAHGIKLFWLGEPLLHPHFNDYLRYLCEHLKQKRVAEYINFDTNGTFLTPETSEALIEYGWLIPYVTISLDAVTPIAYSKIRIGGDFSKVMDNLDYFLKKRKELGKNSPCLALQFILMEENKDEVKDFIEFWRHKLEEYFVPGNDYFKDIIWIKRMDTPDPVKQEEYNVFFVKTLEELDIKSEELLFAKIVAVLSNNWNEK